jgi:hypothetical protein
MSTNFVNVRKKFNDGKTDSLFNGIPLINGQAAVQVIETQDEVPFVIKDDQPLEIKLVGMEFEAEELEKRKRIRRDPRLPLIIGNKTFKFYIYLESHKAFNFNVTMDEKGYTISQRSCLVSSKTVLISRLPRQLNILPVRILLLPMEVGWKILQFTVGILGFIIKTGFPWKETPGNTNITVGSDEGAINP